jgi:GNAT superfamily N-acetyltransferase
MIDIRALTPDDNRAEFRSGDADLDRFFNRFAGQNQFRHHIGVTYVAVEACTILGFATVAAAQIDAVSLPADVVSGLPRYPLPILRLARLAVSDGAKGRGVGQTLLRFVFDLAATTATQIGCVGIVVDAKVSAVAFYEKLGFRALPTLAGELGDRPMPTSMFLALGTAQLAGLRAGGAGPRGPTSL